VQINLGGGQQVPLFGFGHGFFRPAKGRARPGFNFDKHQAINTKQSPSLAIRSTSPKRVRKLRVKILYPWPAKYFSAAACPAKPKEMLEIVISG
jgi:hypothetical protein